VVSDVQEVAGRANGDAGAGAGAGVPAAAWLDEYVNRWQAYDGVAVRVAEGAAAEAAAAAEEGAEEGAFFSDLLTLSHCAR
jgi:hypothetical protein